MNNLNDDILNKYIDGDLSNEMNLQVKRMLESSPNDMMKYKMLLSVHNKLKTLPEEETSNNFTAKVMLRVQRSLKSKREQNFFVVAVLSLFLLISIGIIGYILSLFIFTSDSGSSGIFNRLTYHPEDLTTMLKNFFSKGNISIIGSIFSFILLISGYFFYDSVKHSKQH